MYKKILVPLDGSEFSECALGHVRAIAKGCQVPEVVLLRVLEPVPNVVYAYVIDDNLRKNIEKNAQTEFKDYLSKTADSLKRDGIVASIVVVSGQPADAILDYTKKNAVDLIIMSTHGRAGLSRWTLGSVADRVVRHSAAPVLTVSPAGCRTGK